MEERMYGDRSDRVNDAHMYMPEGKPDRDNQKVPNKGEIMFAEKHPADPLKDEATRHMSHRGGMASARTEHY
jgi:hypothetical protein